MLEDKDLIGPLKERKDDPSKCESCGWVGLVKDLEVLKRIGERPSEIGCPECKTKIISVFIL